MGEERLSDQPGPEGFFRRPSGSGGEPGLGFATNRRHRQVSPPQVSLGKPQRRRSLRVLTKKETKPTPGGEAKRPIGVAIVGSSNARVVQSLKPGKRKTREGKNIYISFLIHRNGMRVISSIKYSCIYSITQKL